MWLKTLRLSHIFVVLFILAAGSIWAVMSVHAAPPAVASVSDHNYHISGDAILCDGKPIIMRGINAMNIYAATYRVENVTLRHVNVENQLGYNGVGNDPPEYSGGYPDYGWMGFKHLPAHGLYVRHAKNVKLEDCHFTSKADDSRPDVVLRDVIP